MSFAVVACWVAAGRGSGGRDDSPTRTRPHEKPSIWVANDDRHEPAQLAGGDIG